MYRFIYVWVLIPLCVMAKNATVTTEADAPAPPYPIEFVLPQDSALFT